MEQIMPPQAVKDLIARLERCGYPTYLVGGCVRDSLLSRAPKDWDIATAARPAQVAAALAGCKLIPTGLKHGTVTAVVDGAQYEITTFRRDADYTDGRRPDRVEFTAAPEEDLSRRDFTINAMAYHPERGLLDPFGGSADLKRGLIRCVGDPAARFEEDRLRILRAYRFSMRLGFAIEPQTRRAALARKQTVKSLSAERIRAEFDEMLDWTHRSAFYAFLWAFSPVLFPWLERCKTTPQKNPYHCRPVYGHTMAALRAYQGDDRLVKLAILFHDAGKPLCRVTDENGIDHFYGHARESARIAAEALKAMRYDNRRVSLVTELTARHDLPLAAARRCAVRLLNRMGPAQARRLMAVKRADASGQSALGKSRLPALEDFERILEERIAAGAAFSLHDLAVTGRDVMDRFGWKPSPQVGEALAFLLNAVLDGRCENERGALLSLLDARAAQKKDG